MYLTTLGKYNILILHVTHDSYALLPTLRLRYILTTSENVI